MATAYHRDQAGAPALSYTANQYDVAHFTAFKTILKACLVTGYGSFPAAGWSLVAEGSDYLVLRNGSASGYVCFSWLGGQTTVYLAETYTGMSGRVMTGDGLKSGAAANNASPQRINATALAYAANSSTWSLVADDKSFVLALSCAINTSAVELGSSSVNANAPLTLYVGEDSLGHFIAVGGINSSSTAPTLSMAVFDGGGFTALKNPATGLLVATGSLAIELPGFVSTAAVYTFSGVILLAEIALCPAVWNGGGVYAGRLRGVCWSPVLARHYSSKAANCLGYVGTMTTRTANTPINLGDTYNYFMAPLMNWTTTFMLTNNPDFW